MAAAAAVATRSATWLATTDGADSAIARAVACLKEMDIDGEEEDCIEGGVMVTVLATMATGTVDPYTTQQPQRFV